MFVLIEALNFRCLRWVSHSLGPFHVLVGPNASGKTTFLDTVGFLKDIVDDGLDAAINNRTANPEELLFRRQGESFELAVESPIPDDLRARTAWPELDTVRYEVRIGFDETKKKFEFKAEQLLLRKSRKNKDLPGGQRMLFPDPPLAPDSIQTSRGPRDKRIIVKKVAGGNDNFYSETYNRAGKGWMPSFKLGPMKSALGNLPADEENMPVAVWFRRQLTEGVQRFVLNSMKIRQPSPPTKVKGFLPDGSNLPWVVSRLRREEELSYRRWIEHLQTALPDLESIDTVERPEDRHCYLVYRYRNGLTVPSWFVSDGTLRLSAITLPAYLPDLQGVYLIEEPENGIHPRAVSTVYDSLSSVYSAQVLLATHSPVVLGAANPETVLCFAKDQEGATDIVRGSEHPGLREWRGTISLGDLLAMGVLG